MVAIRSLCVAFVGTAGIGVGGAAAFLPPLPSRKNAMRPSHHAAATPSLLVVAAAPQSQSAESPRTLVQKGMQAFKDGAVSSSLEYFDRADAALPDGSLRPYLWQRGISYYYLDRFKEGSAQFRLDVRVNPLDVEEIVWDIACQAREGAQYPSKGQMMALPAGRKDRRKIMSTVYSLFRDDGATEFDLREAGHDGNVADEFYSLFYLGLYCEARNEMTKAETYMKGAASSKYATGPGVNDYMTSCAKVHCKLRGWV